MAGSAATVQSRAMKMASEKSALLFPLSVAWALSGIGCTSPSPPAAFAPQTSIDEVSYWDGDDMIGSSSIRISLSEQRAYFYKGGQLAGVSLISSGREGLDTVTG